MHLIFRDDQGKFADYPSDDEGGSASIFHPERVNSGVVATRATGGASPTQDSDDEEKTFKGSADDSASRGAKSKSKRSYDDKGGDKKGGKDLDDEEESGFTIKPSNFVKQLRKGQKTFEGSLS